MPDPITTALRLGLDWDSAIRLSLVGGLARCIVALNRIVAHVLTLPRTELVVPFAPNGAKPGARTGAQLRAPLRVKRQTSRKIAEFWASDLFLLNLGC